MITDYLGNEIKEGMEVCFVKIIDRQVMRFLGFHNLSKEENAKIQEPIIPDMPCWEVGDYIKLNHGLRYTTQVGEFTVTTSFPPMFWDDYTSIIAIKGVSDTKEQYLEYLKTKH